MNQHKTALTTSTGVGVHNRCGVGFGLFCQHSAFTYLLHIHKLTSSAYITSTTSDYIILISQQHSVTIQTRVTSNLLDNYE